MKTTFYIFITILVLFSPLLYPDNINYDFKNITDSDGLSSNLIKNIFQDKNGFIWIASYYGINHYDGIKFRIFNHHPDDPNSLPDVSQTSNFCEDLNGNIWIGSKNGLSKYNHLSQNFTNYYSNPTKTGNLIHNHIHQIKKDSDGKVWITSRGGVSKYNPEKNNFSNYRLTGYNYGQTFSNFRIYFDILKNLWIWDNKYLYRYDKIKDTFVNMQEILNLPFHSDFFELTAVSQDQKGNLVIGSTEGLFHYLNQRDLKKINTQFITSLLKGKDDFLHFGTKTGLYQYFTQTQKSLKISDKMNTRYQVIQLFRDKNNTIWIFTDLGVRILKNKTKFLEMPEIDQKKQNNLRNVNSIFEDQSGVIWIGTFGSGLYKVSTYTKKFNFIKKFDSTNNNIDNRVRTIYQDKNQVLWVGNNDGLYKINRNKKSSKLYNSDHKNPDKLNSFPILTISPFTSQKLLVGTWSGLKIFLLDKGTFEPFIFQYNNRKITFDNAVFYIFHDQKDQIWVGTNMGALVFNKNTETLINNYKTGIGKSSLTNNAVNIIFEDSKNNIWIGTNDGLNQLLEDRKTVIQYKKNDIQKPSISYNYITSVFEDHSKNLWIGTSGGGLNLFNYEDRTFTHFTNREGLSNNAVTAILEDACNNLWISTYKGITKFNFQNKTFKNYYESDGLQKGDFNTNAYFLSTNGEMFFGGMNGLNSFFPMKISTNPHIPPVSITDFKLEGMSIRGQSSNLYQSEKLNKGTIKIPFGIKNISLEFAVLDFNNPHSNQYSYKFEGKDDKWTSLKNVNKITFRNFNPGTYKIRVKGANNDGKWNSEGTYINLIVTPPFWLTWWFKFCVIGLFFLAALFFFRRFKHKLQRFYQKENALNEMYISKNITKREKEIIDLVIKGKNNKDIEDELFISIRTVTSHKYNIYKKLKVSNSGELKFLIKTFSEK